MKVSLNWLREFTSVDLPIDKLVEKIGTQLGEVESVTDVSKKYKGILLVKVVECVKHPDADKLSLCLIDDGGVNKKIKRDKSGLIQVVCGAPNVKAGQLAVWIPPGSLVPASFDKEPFVIEAREIRGQMSNGMLASIKELDIGASHDGILVLEKGQPGDNFAKTLWLDDYIIDIENKMFTHRPDLFGMLGVAREIAGIEQRAFKSPDWYQQEAKLPSDGRKNVLKLKVKNELPKLVPRFSAIIIKDVKVEPSPAWLQSFLSRVGVRPINNIVDITNLVMLETAQPLHAYDYDKLGSGTLGVRLCKAGEQLELIGGKQLKLEIGAVVITDGKQPIGLGGVMGGASTEVDDSTKNIILESANFDMNTTRRSAMTYGLFTDAATRFTKNQSPHQTVTALVRAVTQVQQIAGGRQASPAVDDKHIHTKNAPLNVSTDFINQRLGEDLNSSQIKKLLENVEFQVDTKGEHLVIEPPFWRTDIEIAEDIVEEVGRLYGYDRLPLGLPKRDLSPTSVDPMIELKNAVRGHLATAGANEVLTYSFVHSSLIEAAGQKTEQSYHLKNALSPELQYYRQALVPSLLEKVHPNIKTGYDDFSLFEIGKIHIKGTLDKQKLPLEFQNLALVLASKQAGNGAAYFAAKKYLEFLLQKLGVDGVRYSQSQPRSEAYDAKRSAWVFTGDKMLGVLGEPSQKLRSSLKLPSYTAQFELNLNALLDLPESRRYQPLPRFPSLEQDICLRSSADLSYEQLTNFVASELEEISHRHSYRVEIMPIDIFQREGDKKHKQTTWRIRFIHPQRTLTNEEVNQALDILAAEAKDKLNAERI